MMEKDYIEYTLKKPINLYLEDSGERVGIEKTVKKIYIDVDIKVKHLRKLPAEFFEKMDGGSTNIHPAEMISLMGAMCNLPDRVFDEMVDEDFNEVGNIVGKIIDKKKSQSTGKNSSGE